jgi:hypothetical protein
VRGAVRQKWRVKEGLFIDRRATDLTGSIRAGAEPFECPIDVVQNRFDLYDTFVIGLGHG